MDVKELNLEEIGHEHPLTLVDLQQMHRDYLEDDDDFDENDMIAMQNFKCICNRCDVEIDWYHRYYYKCSISCNYNLHKFCRELPSTFQFQGHPNHSLILTTTTSEWTCHCCHKVHRDGICYNCSSCIYAIDLRCATFVEQKTIHHPSHPHPLISVHVDPILSKCYACRKKHEGGFYHCPTCFNFSINSDCVSLPIKLLLQNHQFNHRHLLTLSYTFQHQFYDFECRICGKEIENELLIYKCSKCMYYVHPDCATQRFEPLPGFGKTEKNFQDADHPRLIHYPLPDESYNILSHQLLEQETTQVKDINGQLVHFCHRHPLVLIQDEIDKDSTMKNILSRNKLASLHDPMKRIKLLCSGCVRPITKMPFYKCSEEFDGCNFVLHKWCTRLSKKLQNHIGHPQHTLELSTSSEGSVFTCSNCQLPCNGFSYHCVSCKYVIDINCGFLPEEITHEAHPNHLLTRVEASSSNLACRACRAIISKKGFYFRCTSCDFNIDYRCALLLPKTIRHKYDKHYLKLSYSPIEDHKSRYFCEICEEDLDPTKWFYHCLECAQSIHSACAPLVYKDEQGVNSVNVEGVYKLLNIKFGAIDIFHKAYDEKIPFMIYHTRAPHPHPLVFAPGTKQDGSCDCCRRRVRSHVIWKCTRCKFVRHYFNCFTYLLPIWNPPDKFNVYKKKKIRRIQTNGGLYPNEIIRPVTRDWKVIDQ